MSTPKVDLKSLWVNSGRKKYFIALGVTGCLAIGALGSTLAANISLNSGEVVEFGQGIVQTTACSGEDSLTVTPESTFINEVGAGAHYFTSLTVSDIPLSCLGATFTLAAYDASQIRSWSDCTDPGHQLSILFTETQTVPTDASLEDMYSNVTDSNANSFTVTWIGGQDSCDSEILAGDLRALTIQSSGNPTGVTPYLADYTAGSTSFVSSPLVIFDAVVNPPVDATWGNTGSISFYGDAGFDSSPTLNTDLPNPYVSLENNYLAGLISGQDTDPDRVSVEMWVGIADTGGTFQRSLFSFDTNDDREGMYGCGYSLAFYNGNLGINTCRGDLLGFSAGNLEGSWNHIVWIASTGSRFTQKIYLNGILQTLTYRGPENTLVENPRPTIGNGNYGMNTWSTRSTIVVGALKIYEGEMPPVVVQSKSEAFEERLTP
jgi:hypothetical protein